LTLVLEIVFWVSLGLIFFTHLGYPAVLWLLVALGRGHGSGSVRERPSPFPGTAEEATEGPGLPSVTVIVAAYDEQEVIAQKVENLRALDYPAELVEVVVASDGSTDRTVADAEAAGADLVLDLPRTGKTAAQDEAVARAGGEIVAFSDANSAWEPGALRELVEPFADPKVAYVCGRVDFIGPDGGNLEGAYWSWEMKVRRLESDLAGVTAGNGAIYAVRRSSYVPLGPTGSHDLSFPAIFAREGALSLYRPEASAREPVVPSLEGELARKRRMMVGLWDILFGERLADLRGYGPAFGFEILSHRLLRYATPLLHVLLLVANALLLGAGTFYVVFFVLQVLFLLAAVFGRWLPILPFRVARYYVMTTASIGLGFWDRARRGRPGTWEKAEGTR
jgi:cellulose synthase/poly-beta-1,6-N-acetylglucosamine synthase-like glycosyltransferase